MLLKSKNNIPVWVDWEHMKNHFDLDSPGGTFCFSEEEALQKFGDFLDRITLPDETPKSFWGDPTPPPGSFIYKTLLEIPEIVGWNSLYKIRCLPDNTKVEWQIRRGYLTMCFPNILPKECKTVAFVFAHFDQKRLIELMKTQVALRKYSAIEEHPHYKFACCESEWILLTSFPGILAPPQSDTSFWREHGFATGKHIDLKNMEYLMGRKKNKKIENKNVENNNTQNQNFEKKENQQPLLVDTDDTFQAVLKTYEHVQHWITLADTKAGLVLTIQGVLVGFILQQMMLWKSTLFAETTAVPVFYTIIVSLCCYFLLKITSFLYVVRVFFPRVLKEVDYSQTRHIFNVGISREFPKSTDNEKFWQEYQKLTETDLKKEYVYQIHIDSRVCSLKYNNLTKSMKTLLYSICFAFIVFVSTVVFL